ncbi:MAG: hypothetical protein JO302_01450 [Candidatus Eremiobacteraeota bacterium]|nr:hypothetical protein [Candidatus Eremiobacteraeota bacterium]
MSLPSFHIPGSQLAMGASLGNSAIWIHTKGDGSIEHVFLNEIGQSLLGTFWVRYGGRSHHESLFYSGLLTESPREFEIHPAYQRVRFQLAGKVAITETTFLPFSGGEPNEDPPIAYVTVDFENLDPTEHTLRVIGAALLRGGTSADVFARFDPDARAIVAHNASQPEWVRVLSISEQPTAYSIDSDYGASYDATYQGAASDAFPATGDPIGRLQCDFELGPHGHRQICFAIGLYATGEDGALGQHARIADPAPALERTVQSLEEILRAGNVLTPDPVINEGALWSKVNMRRVMAAYPTGQAFTNDPGKYANVVIRDAAWFIFGNDHFLPAFSRRLLDNLSQRQYPDGKMPEYFDGVSGRIEDDGLNINDDTPLYVLAVNHHFRATGDRDWLTATYPIVARAARYIISQVDDRGLVFCMANDPRGNVWGIAGWRNIISGYKINGAVTEINAECVAALRAAAHLAENLGGQGDDQHNFADASERIRQAMDAHLINPRNGLYYLNIDVEGHAHTDVTGDEIFPVIMRACSEDTGFRIISRLNAPDFVTEAGMRTVSRIDPRFNSAAESGLLGGIWPGLTWWYAFGAARYHPSFMVRALRSSFEHYGTDPRRYNTVPGQFSEWFDGESLANRGMRLSPWEPPRFLWAAIEGVCGLELTTDQPRINPLIPAHWSWAALRNVPYHGGTFSYFLIREADSGFRIYLTGRIECRWTIEPYERDVSDAVIAHGENTVTIAFARPGSAVILVGNTGPQSTHAPLSINDTSFIPEKAALRVYNSERKDWEPPDGIDRDALKGRGVFIEGGGFRLLELTSSG